MKKKPSGHLLGEADLQLLQDINRQLGKNGYHEDNVEKIVELLMHPIDEDYKHFIRMFTSKNNRNPTAKEFLKWWKENKM